MEKQCKVTQLTWEEFKSKLLNTSFLMGLGEGDLKHLEESEGTKFVILETTTSDTTERRFETVNNIIYKEIKNLEFSPTSSWKVLFLIFYPESSPILMTDINYIKTFLGKFPPNLELKWDMATNDIDVCKIICCLRI